MKTSVALFKNTSWNSSFRANWDIEQSNILAVSYTGCDGLLIKCVDLLIKRIDMSVTCCYIHCVDVLAELL